MVSGFSRFYLIRCFLSSFMLVVWWVVCGDVVVVSYRLMVPSPKTAACLPVPTADMICMSGMS